MAIITILLIGVLSGYLADKFMKLEKPLWQDIVAGLGGGALGAIVLAIFGVDSIGGLIAGIILAIGGACLILWGWNKFEERKGA